MGKWIVGVSLLAVGVVAFPATSGAEFSYGTLPVSSNKQQLQFSDGTKCNFQVDVVKSGGLARSNARYRCFNQKAPVKPFKIVLRNEAGVWLSGNHGKATSTTCTTLQCSAPEATHTVKSNQNATGSLIAHVYYPRSHGLGFPPPFCEYVKDPQGKGPPGYRITCAIQARTG